MLTPELLKVVAGVSTLFGLLGIVACFFLVHQYRSAEQSVRSVVEGERLFNAEQVLRILETFKDDTARLEALKALAGHDEKRARELLVKIKDNVDVSRLTESSRRNQRQLAIIAAIFFFALGLIAYAASVRGTGSGSAATSQPQPQLQSPPQPQPQEFAKTQYVDVGCEKTSTGRVEYALPENAYEVQRECSWNDRSNIKSASCVTEVAGSTVRASGSIIGLDKQLFNCPGGGHATLVLKGSYKVKP